MITEAINTDNPIYKKIVEETSTPIPKEVSLLVLEGIDSMISKKEARTCVKKFDVLTFHVMETEQDIINFWKDRYKLSGENSYTGSYLSPSNGEFMDYCYFALGSYLVVRKTGKIEAYSAENFNQIYTEL